MGTYRIKYGGKEETLTGVNLESALESAGFKGINIEPSWRLSSNGKYTAYCSGIAIQCEWLEKIERINNNTNKTIRDIMKTSIVVISNVDKETYFFSKDHCQNHGLGNDYVACTHYLPSQVVPRECVPDGVIKNKEDLVAVFYSNMKEISNPDKSMQPTFQEEIFQEERDKRVHIAHCYQGEYKDSCKYGEEKCPAYVKPEPVLQERVETLTDDYKRRLTTITEIIENTHNNGGYNDSIRNERLITKQSEYRAIIAELERISK